jgi:hypothetical protein
MPYTYSNLGQVRTQLSERLFDTAANPFWSNAEKNAYIVEALRTWNGLTSFWKSEFIFQTDNSQFWYNIPALTNTLRSYTLTDNDLIQMIQYHLLEPVTSAYPLAWTGSAQFSIADILNAIQRRRDEVLSITGCTITQRNVPANPGRTILPDSVIGIRRVAWLPVTTPSGFTASPLLADDQWALQAFDTNYTTNDPGEPTSYRQSSEPPLSFDVDTQPAVPGQYDVLTVDAGPALTDQNSTLLGVPDDFAWVIKWGALADLFSRESNAKDPIRAQYCEMRYRQGLAILMNSPAILYARINNLPLDIDAIQNYDDYRVGWQAEPVGSPDMLGVAGLNLIAIGPRPDAVYAVTMMVVENAPVPVNDGDFVQVSKDDLEAILDYAQHMAALKMGGTEFISTIPLVQRFHKQALVYNHKLNELGEFTKPTYELSQLQAEANPVYDDVNFTPEDEQ